MSEGTKIEWCRNSDGSPGYTFNPWWGCQRVSPGCDHCYAAGRRLDGREHNGMPEVTRG